MKLIIAEKPQLGSIIAEALGVIRREDGYIQCQDDHVVTWAIGHVLELKMPEEMNPEYKVWNEEDLPLQLRPLALKPKEATEGQFFVIQSLLKRAHFVIHAGDPDDEGELLIREILEFHGFKGKVERLLLNDLNAQAARKALEDLRPDSEFDGMYYKALARSHADYIYGMNLSRAYTLAARAKGLSSVYSVGRVQTPTLGLIVRRFLEHQNHQALFYYDIFGDFEFQGKTVKAKLHIADDVLAQAKEHQILHEEGKEMRIVDKEFAEMIREDCEGCIAHVEECKIDSRIVPPPLPFSLLDLQVHCNHKYGFSAEETLNITQSLREKHQAITYNRSDCRYLSTEQFEAAPQTLDFLGKLFPDLPFSSAHRAQKSRAFNDRKITAHTGIIPVVSDKLTNLSELSDQERKVFEAIATQYLVQFLPDKRYDIVTVFIDSAYVFKASAIKITDHGWSKLVPDEAEAQNDHEKFDLLVALQGPVYKRDGMFIRGITKVLHKSVEIKKEKTKPLPLYTEATLLKDLQRVARFVEDPHMRALLLEKDKGREGENGGIGTPATRSAIIKNLHQKGFFEYQGKKLIPTAKGIDFIEALPRIVTVPDTTALWFEQQLAIEKGELSVEEFLDDIEKFVGEQIKAAKNIALEVKGEPCSCGQGVLVLKSAKDKEFFACTAYPECKITKPALDGRPAPNCPCCGNTLKVFDKGIFCSTEDCLILWRQVSGKTLTDSQLLALLLKGETEKMRGFKSAKTGRFFEAKLKLSKAKKKAELVFSRSPTKIDILRLD